MHTEVARHSTKVSSAWTRKRSIEGQRPPGKSRNPAPDPGQYGTRCAVRLRAGTAPRRSRSRSRQEPPRGHARSVAKRVAWNSSPQKVNRLMNIGYPEIPGQGRMFPGYFLVHRICHGTVGEVSGMTAAQL